MLALMRSMARPGNRIEEFGLVCENSDGKQLMSDQVYLVGYSHNSERLLVQLRAREACLRMPAREKHRRPALCFWLLGFECFPPVQVATSLGSIVVRGASRTKATDEITGSICAQGPDGSQATTWRKSSEHMLKHLCSVLGFARGARLSVPVIEFYEGNDVEVIFLETSAGYASQMPPISHLHLQPIVTTALANLNHVDDHRDAFETAVGWLLVPTTFDEVRFLTGMTALESLAARSLENSKRDILSNSAFKKFGKRVRALVDEQGYLDESTKRV